MAGSTKRFMISLPSQLVEAVDRQAKADYTTRSGLVRQALMEYLRPVDDGQLEGQELYTDPEEVLRMLQQRKLRASVQMAQRQMKRDRRGVRG